MAKRVRTPKFRVSFPDLFKPTSYGNQGPRFKVTMLFPKDADLSPLKDAAQEAIEEKWGSKPPKGLRLPFRNGDEKPDLDGYAGHVFVRAWSGEDRPPVVVGPDRRPITDPRQVYAGCYAYAMVTAFAYDREDGKGVGFVFDSVLKAGEGEPFGTKADPDADFEGIEAGDPILD